MTAISTYDHALEAIWDRSGYDKGFISNPFAGDEVAKLGLHRTRALLNHFGHQSLPYEIVHVAGSKGKGSTCVMTDAILRRSGMRTGRHLSPHLHSFRERFVVDNALISEADFTSLARQYLEAAEVIENRSPELGQITAFELTTAMALGWFAMSDCEVAVIEVGMGGTLDATNVVEPTVSVITMLDYEHTTILGETMREIASNKAGIIKSNRPVISANQPSDGMVVVKEKAQEVDAPLSVAGVDWKITGTEDNFTYSSESRMIANLHCNLAGAHQLENAGLAITAALIIGTTLQAKTVSDAAIRQALANVSFPGRFERVQLPADQTMIIDGAHTPASAQALAETMLDRFPGTKVTVVIGMLGDKNPGAVIAPLLSCASHWITVTPDSPRAVSAGELHDALVEKGIAADQAPNLRHGIEMAKNTSADVILVTGSLSTAAEARVVVGLSIGAR